MSFLVPKKILITGPESTGKSTLCTALADHFDTVWIKEYAREYLNTNGLHYVESDLLAIAKEQFKQQNSALPQAVDFLFCDTGLEVIKVWSDYKYHQCHPWITHHMKEQQFDLVLLCDIDIPWEYDELREYPDPLQRQSFLQLYKKELTALYGHYHLISGTVQQRIDRTLTLLQQL